jgi:hypothetical protein
VPNELPARWVPALPGARASRLCAAVFAALILAPAALPAVDAPSSIHGGRAARRGVSRPLTEIARGLNGRPASAPKAAPRANRRAKTGDAPSVFLQFDGLSFNDNLPFYDDVFPPPDPSGSVGPNHYVQAINLVFEVFDKDGNSVLGPLPTASLWTTLGGVCATGAAATPHVRYDQLADRWVLGQSAYDSSDASVHECLAVSQAPDPTGAYNAYDFPLGASAQAGSARLGLWPDAYYVTVNQLDGFANAGIGVYAFDRNAMLNGEQPGFVYANPGADLPNTLWGLPADLDGSELPSPTAPEVIAALGHPLIDGSPTARIHVWNFQPNFQDPPSSTLTGPTDVEQDDFNPLDCGSPSQGCVPQLNSNQLLQATPNRLMSRMPYRKFLDHDSLVATFTVATDGGQAAPRWFELRDPLGFPTMFQQGTYAPDTSHRFVPSILMNQTGAIALAYNKSDATIHPSLAWTYRLPGDPPGTMPGEDPFFEGPNSQPPVVGFWGSYSSLALDPFDQCTMWFTAEYTGDPSPLFERTRVAVLNPICGDVFGGNLEGTVTDASSGSPIPGVHVHIAGLGADTLTDAAGDYRFLELPQGTYDVTVSKYGYVSATATGVVIQFEQTTTQDFALAPAPQALLNGTVKDGSGGGWPLYARVTVSGPGFGSTQLYTDPVTGYYGISLVAGISYTLSTEGVLPGYTPDQRSVFLQAAGPSLPDGVQNVLLAADATSCSAPGYALVANGLTEHFDSGGVPPGWQAVEEGGGAGWTIQATGDPCGLFAGNDTGGSGPYALVNSHCEGEVLEDAQLITAPLDASALSSVQIRFAQELNGPFPPAGESAEVDVSTDGGGTWTNVLHESASALGPDTQSVDVTALAAGQPDVRARFHYYNAFSAWWWQVDDVIVGQTSCAARSGGLVVGNVFDANTGTGLNGALVVKGSGERLTHTFATPDDPAQPDGLYVIFSESGPQFVSASQTFYSYRTKPITVVPNAAQRLDFQLDAGFFQVSPTSLAVRVDPGGTDFPTLTMSNIGDGDGPATYGIHELYVPLTPPTPPGGFDAEAGLRARALARLTRPELANAPSARGLGALPGGPPAARVLQDAGDVVNAFPTGLEAAWGLAFDADYQTIWITNSLPFAGDELEYQFLSDGTNTGFTIDDSSWIADWAADGAYDARHDKIWRLNVGGDECVYAVDPDYVTVSGERICPAFGTSQRGLAYDPVTDTFYSGSWNDGVIQHFDATGRILDTAYVAIPISGLGFDPTTERLYALANHDVLLGYDVYVLDTRNHYAIVGAFFVTSGGSPVLSPNGQAGLEVGCDGRLWLIDSTTQTLYEVDAGGSNACDVLEIPWVFEEPHAFNVPPHSSLDVLCAFNSAGLTPGMRQGILRIITNTPYRVPPIPISLTVRFLDVPDGSAFDPYIYAAAGAGVMPGCEVAGSLFCPTGLVTRADMAAYILRAVHGPGFVPTPYAGTFADVHAGDYNADYIQSFFDEGYTAGCGGGNFCPNAAHTRAQTSVFILKGEHGTSYVAPPCSGIFNDVPCSSGFAPWIEELYNEGITAGCGGGNFCPDAGIPNQQMAVFLVKAFGIPHL